MSDAPPTHAEAPTVTARTGRARPIAALICLLLAALLTIPATFAFWGQRTLNDTQRYVATVGPLIHSTAVQDAITTRVTEVIDKQVNVESIIDNVFSGVITDRPRLQQLVGPLSGAVNGFIDSQVKDFVASPAFADIWVAVNTKAQEAFVRVLKGDNSGAVSLQGDQIVLDLGDLITQIQQRLVARGLTIASKIPVSQVDKQIVLVDAPQLKKLKTIYAFTNPIAKWLIVLVGALYLAALLLSRRRPRMTGYIGLALAVNALLVALLLSVGRQLFINELDGTAFAQASSVFYDQLLTYLERGRQVLFWLGVTFVAVGWFAGRNASGTAARAWVTDGLETIGSSMADGPVGTAGKWTAANATWLRIVITVLGAGVLLWGNSVTMPRLFWALVVVGVLLAAVQVLVGAGTRTRPPGGVPVAAAGATAG